MLYFFIISLLFFAVTFRPCASLDRNIAEDAFLSSPELISKYGYPSEIHNVITKDGYILGIHRIPHGKNSDKIEDPKKVVLLSHGVLGSSADLIVTGPNHALAYLLADSGYDVWLLNCRGNTYSRNHTSLNPNSRKFWNFSFHEIAIHDLADTIDYILQTTKNDDLNYVAHSQGTTIFFVLTSMMPEYNQKIRLSVLLAPVVFVKHIKIVILEIISPFESLLFGPFRLLGLDDFLPASKTRTKVTNAVCADGSFTQPICSEILFQAGRNTLNLNRTILPVIYGHYPAGCSVKQLQHYAQEIVSGHFRQYDYGLVRNKLMYDSILPPDYNLKNVVAPVFLFTSGNDGFSDLRDVAKLVKQLPNLKQNIRVADPKFSHTDYTYGIDAREFVYKPVVQILEQFQ